MAMRDAILAFHTQFSYEPQIENSQNFVALKKFIVLGMGGSHWAADLLKTCNPALNITIHNNYGLPALSQDILKSSLIIASSYSGNTEETIDGFRTAIEKRLPLIAIATGGMVLDIAKNQSIPYIQMPSLGIQPRSALGFSMRSLLKAMSEEDALVESSGLARSLEPSRFESRGKEIAENLKGSVPVIYASSRNAALAYVWKIKFNETGKIPAFANIFPELNHNEMTGFDVKESTKGLSKSFSFLLLKDADDHPQIRKRMEILEKLYRDRNLTVAAINLAGDTCWDKVFSSVILADWAAYYTAGVYGVEPEQVPMVDEFKRLVG